jgi:hypothetical protein
MILSWLVLCRCDVTTRRRPILVRTENIVFSKRSTASGKSTIKRITGDDDNNNIIRCTYNSKREVMMWIMILKKILYSSTETTTTTAATTIISRFCNNEKKKKQGGRINQTDAVMESLLQLSGVVVHNYKGSKREENRLKIG